MLKRCYIGKSRHGFEAFCTDVPTGHVPDAHGDYSTFSGPFADMAEAREVARLANDALALPHKARRALVQAIQGKGWGLTSAQRSASRLS